MSSVSRSCRCVAVSAIRPLPKAAEAIGLGRGKQAYLRPYHLSKDKATVAIAPGNGAMAANATQLNGSVERHMKKCVLLSIASAQPPATYATPSLSHDFLAAMQGLANGVGQDPFFRLQLRQN